MAKERIRKLAKRLDLTVESVFHALSALGHDRYRLPDDTLPESVVEELERHLRKNRQTHSLRSRVTSPHGGAALPVRPQEERRPAVTPPLPTEIPEDPGLNALLQEYRSAKPMAEIRAKLPSKPIPAPNPPVPPVASTEAALRESLGAEIRQRRLLSESLEASKAELAQLKARSAEALHRLTTELETVRANAMALALRAEEEMKVALAERDEREDKYLSQIRVLQMDVSALAQSEREHKTGLQKAIESEYRLRKDFEGLRARLADEIVARQVVDGQVEQLHRRLRDAMARAQALPAPTPAPTPTPGSLFSRADAGRADAGRPSPLDEVLEKRGLKRPSEVRAALEVLLRDPHYHDSMELLATFSRAAFLKALERRIALLCEGCEPPQGVAAVRVEEAVRCEVCRGQSGPMAATAMADACRARGLKRVQFLGLPPKMAAELSSWVGPDLEVSFPRPPSEPELGWLRRQLDAADLTLVWLSPFLEHRMPSLVRQVSDPRLISLAHRGVAGALRQAAEMLEAKETR